MDPGIGSPRSTVICIISHVGVDAGYYRQTLNCEHGKSDTLGHGTKKRG